MSIIMFVLLCVLFVLPRSGIEWDGNSFLSPIEKLAKNANTSKIIELPIFVPPPPNNHIFKVSNIST